MSEEGDRFWFTLSEKVIGLVLIIISALLLYFTWDTSSALGGVTWIFAVLGVVVLVVGILMMISKSSE